MLVFDNIIENNFGFSLTILYYFILVTTGPITVVLGSYGDMVDVVVISVVDMAFVDAIVERALVVGISVVDMAFVDVIIVRALVADTSPLYVLVI
jgi:hypothetical protein